MLVFQRWICKEHPEVDSAVEPLLHSYDLDKCESMASIVVAYNKAVRVFSVFVFSLSNLSNLSNSQVKGLVGKEVEEKNPVAARPGQRASKDLLKHIIQQVFREFHQINFFRASETDSL